MIVVPTSLYSVGLIIEQVTERQAYMEARPGQFDWSAPNADNWQSTDARLSGPSCTRARAEQSGPVGSQCEHARCAHRIFALFCLFVLFVLLSVRTYPKLSDLWVTFYGLIVLLVLRVTLCKYVFTPLGDWILPTVEEKKGKWSEAARADRVQRFSVCIFK